MELKHAMKILEIVKCDNLGYCRDLSYTPTAEEIGQAVETVQCVLDLAGIEY